jgi:hypothetical protein
LLKPDVFIEFGTLQLALWYPTLQNFASYVLHCSWPFHRNPGSKHNATKMGAKFLIRVQFGSQEQFVCSIRRDEIASTVTYQFWKEFRLLSHLDHMQLRLFLDSGEELYSGDRLYPLRHHVFVLKVVSKTALSYFEQWKVDRSNVYWNILGQHVVLNTRERSVKYRLKQRSLYELTVWRTNGIQDGRSNYSAAWSCLPRPHCTRKTNTTVVGTCSAALNLLCTAIRRYSRQTHELMH